MSSIVTKPSTDHASPADPPRPSKRGGARHAKPGPAPGSGGSIGREAQRLAAVILETLAGVRTPADAAQVLAISVPRYYVWEERAVAGMVAACELRPKATGMRPPTQIRLLEKEVARLKQECARHQALVRATQRTVGLTPPPPTKSLTKAPSKSGGKKHRKRRPVIRALKAAATLRAEPLASSSGMTPGEVLQQGVVKTTLAAPDPGLSPARSSAAAP